MFRNVIDRKSGQLIVVYEEDDPVQRKKVLLARSYQDRILEDERQRTIRSMCPKCHLSRSEEEVKEHRCDSCGYFE